ncbi:conserved protein of unknown function [Rhodovastum atsumiense]|uniref:Uncharacterized protein n=1 Tax=Rhodovastum atsumiense TaxID=504468 RepID=A0A5M6IPL3_9PROT|nr:hypothetical protein [Rhodovastum atsumiense]KAA5609897.1 hypothetical protein F1189_22190 [Rhodovastum atsumiense]CAH2602393.1 conserved protein of unknown function [Rhodovastum atsumiense]
MKPPSLKLLCDVAGVTAQERCVDARLGLVISATGLRKLARIAPDEPTREILLRTAAELSRAKWRVVAGGRGAA